MIKMRIIKLELKMSKQNLPKNKNQNQMAMEKEFMLLAKLTDDYVALEASKTREV